jgi:hypothetical protein
VRKKYLRVTTDRANIVTEILDRIRLVLDKEEEPLHDADNEADPVYFQKTEAREEVKLPAGSRGIPSWAPSNVQNHQGLLPASKALYIGLVTINNKLTEVILDTAGSRTMIDSNTARALGLDVTWERVGQFSGVGGGALTYAGMVKGPVEIKFSSKVVLHLDEVKVFDHPEPIILLGDDILGHSTRTPLTFCYLGVNP